MKLFAVMIIVLFISFIYVILTPETDTSMITLFAALLGAAAGGYATYLIENNIKTDNQKRLLNQVAVQINLIKEKTIGFQKELELKGISGYDILKINFEYFLQNLDPEIKGVTTIELLNKLSKIDDKIDLLNKANEEIKRLVIENNYNYLDNESLKGSINAHKPEIMQYCNNIIEELKGFLEDVRKNIEHWDIRTVSQVHSSEVNEHSINIESKGDMKTKFSTKAKILVFIYLSVSFTLLSYAGISSAFKEMLSDITISSSIFIGILIGILGILAIERSDSIRIRYDRFIERLNKNLTDRVKRDLESYSKIQDEGVRNIMIRAYVENVFEKSNSDIWTKVLTVINLLIIGFNLIFILTTSFISNSNPIFALLFQKKIDEIGAANVSQELGIDYAHLSQVYSQNNFGLYLQMITTLPSLIWTSFIVVFYGFIIYFILESAKSARNKAINETITKLYS